MPRTLFLGLALCAAMAAPAHANTVTDWNEYASTAIVVVEQQPPPVASLSFAMVQGAVYDAVNAIDRGHRPYLVEPPARRSDSKDAAAAKAAFVVLDGLFAGREHGTLQTHYDATLAGLRDEPPGALARGEAVGEAAGLAMLAARADDGRGGSFKPVPGSAPGAWRPLTPTAVDPAPWVAFVRPFLVGDVERLRSAPPNALTSRAYARDFNEIKSVGALQSTTRTADETDAAIYWQDHLHGFWNRVFRTLATSRHLGIADSARLFAMTNLAGADAAIGCWNNKYHWNFWRPITAIHEADSDGNPLTEADTQWTPLFSATTPVAPGQPLLVTPPFPDHPSGHTCGTSAFVHTLQAFFGTDGVPFTAYSNRSGTTRSFARLSDALEEVINARVWAGIHFRTADEVGAKLGAKVARYARRL